jgi:erythromycin esterase-like protein
MTDAELVREIAQPLSGGSDDYDALLALIGNARFVLIGEATHGTHEFYSERATITKRLIDETQAIEPLERTSIWEEGELPETYPFKV